jgi:hypothetical protein
VNGYPESWPTDPQQCHDLLGQFAQQVEDLRAALEEAAKLHDQTVQDRDQLVEELRRQIELYRRYVFGPRRERITDAPGQGRLFEFGAIEGVALPPQPPPVLGDGNTDAISCLTRDRTRGAISCLTRTRSVVLV